jgi:Calcineurin-like phosphoesterase
MVLFSGDLTQSGLPEQFAQLTEILEQIRTHLLRFQRDPVFLCVPGNHDLVRPSPSSSVVKAMRQWQKQSDVRGLFWSSESNEYRQTVENCFANYRSWWSGLTIPKPEIFKTGILSGDFSAVADKSGIRVGIIGLNSAFLQLTNDNYEGQLDLDQRQLLAVCNDNPDGWCADVDVALLMTHHGYEWLYKRGKDNFLSEIYPPGRFFSHIHGHLHDPSSINVSTGGAEERRFRQGASLFGLRTDVHLAYIANNMD